MAFRNYIILDGYQYMTPHGDWNPVVRKAATVRKTLARSTDVTFGPASFHEWRGKIIAPPIAQAGWGTISNLIATLDKTEALSFTDHYGLVYSVVSVGEMPRFPFIPDWERSTNEWKVQVRLIRV